MCYRLFIGTVSAGLKVKFHIAKIILLTLSLLHNKFEINIYKQIGLFSAESKYNLQIVELCGITYLFIF